MKLKNNLHYYFKQTPKSRKLCCYNKQFVPFLSKVILLKLFYYVFTDHKIQNV